MNRTVLFILLWLTGLSQYARAQLRPEETENKVHSIFIYNFTKYINWPEEYNKGDFIVGVLGETGLLVELQKMAKQKSVSNRKIVIKQYQTLNEVDQKCHILFIAATSSGQLSSALRTTKGRPTLIITQKDNLGRAGSPINFISVNGRYKFEINLGALEQHGLKCAQQLKTIAILI